MNSVEFAENFAGILRRILCNGPFPNDTTSEVLNFTQIRPIFLIKSSVLKGRGSDRC